MAAAQAGEQLWYVGATNEYAPAGWDDWPGQVDGTPGTVEHYERWAYELIFEDGERHPPERWQLDYVADLLSHVEAWLVVPEGNSKALDVRTLLATPTGWTTMLDVQRGDMLLGSDGRAVRVDAVSPVMIGRPCYEVTFSDGATIVADAEHLWTAEDAYAWGKGRAAHRGARSRTVTTEHLRATLRTSTGACRWRVPAVARVAESAVLPLDPYVLGVWLGDGCRGSGRVVSMDQGVWDRIREVGYEFGKVINGNSGRAITRTVLGLQTRLRALGVLDCKRIPDEYLRASVEQRYALLQGLIDTDGCVSMAGQVTIGQVSANLSADIRRLVWSLGLSCYLNVMPVAIGEQDCGVTNMLTIACDARHPVASLPRKVERLKARGRTTEHRRIVSVEPVRTRPVRCIAVDAPDSLYLAGEAMIPTHNTTLLAGVALYHLETVLEPWVPLGASSRDQAGILFGQAKGFVQRTPGLMYERDLNPNGPFVMKGTRHIDHRYNRGTGLQVYAANEETADGVIPTLALIDEGHRLKDLGTYRLWKGKLEKRKGRIGLISTAGEPGRDFEKTRTALRRSAKKVTHRGPCFTRYESGGAVLHDYAVPEVGKVEDLALVKAANPLSTITVATLAAKRASATLDYGEGWLRLTCNIPARSSKAGVHERDWDAGLLRTGEWADAPDGLIPEGVPVALGIDVAWTNDCTALTPLWIPDLRRRLLGPAEILEPPRDGSMLDPIEVHEAAQRINERNPVYLVVMDVSRAQETAMWLAGGGDDGEFRMLEPAKVIDRTQGNKHASEDYDAFMEALRGGAGGDEQVRERWLRHTGDVGLREHVLNAIARKLPGDRYRFDRPTPSRSEAAQDFRVVDALQAAAMVNRTAAAELGRGSGGPMVAVRGRGGQSQESAPQRPGRPAATPSTPCAGCSHPAGSHLPGGPCNVGRSGAWGEVPCACEGFVGTGVAA